MEVTGVSREEDFDAMASGVPSSANLEIAGLLGVAGKETGSTGQQPLYKTPSKGIVGRLPGIDWQHTEFLAPSPTLVPTPSTRGR